MSEGGTSEGVMSEGVISEGVISEGVISEGGTSEGGTSEGGNSEGVNSEGVIREQVKEIVECGSIHTQLVPTIREHIRLSHSVLTIVSRRWCSSGTRHLLQLNVSSTGCHSYWLVRH